MSSVLSTDTIYCSQNIVKILSLIYCQYIGCVTYATWAFATPFFVAYATPLFVSSATPFFRSFATQTFSTPKNLSLILEALVDKEVAKLVEEVNEELVMDVVVEGVVDNR